MLVELVRKSCSNKNCEQLNPQPIENFYKRGDTACGLYSRCKSCCQKSDDNRKDKTRVYKKNWNLLHGQKHNKKYYQNNRETILLKVREYQEKNRPKIKNSQLKRNYGITLEKYNQMLISQNYKCAICGLDEVSAGKKGLFVDHNHNNNKVRGLLCYSCNFMIGSAKEDVRTLRKAIIYLVTSDKEDKIC